MVAGRYCNYYTYADPLVYGYMDGWMDGWIVMSMSVVESDYEHVGS